MIEHTLALKKNLLLSLHLLNTTWVNLFTLVSDSKKSGMLLYSLSNAILDFTQLNAVSVNVAHRCHQLAQQHGHPLDGCHMVSGPHNTVYTDCVQTHQMGIIIWILTAAGQEQIEKLQHKSAPALSAHETALW